MHNIDWIWLSCGIPCLCVGFVLGYVAGRLQNDHRENKETEVARKWNEYGIFKHRLASNVAAALVVLITAFAAFSSQVASNNANEAVAEVKHQTSIRNAETQCISTIVFATIQALNERTTYTIAQAEANVDLQRAQAELLSFFLNSAPDTPEEAGRAAVARYFAALQKFTDLAAQTANKAEQYEYPTEEEFLDCLHEARNPAQEG